MSETNTPSTGPSLEQLNLAIIATARKLRALFQLAVNEALPLHERLVDLTGQASALVKRTKAPPKDARLCSVGLALSTPGLNTIEQQFADVTAQVVQAAFHPQGLTHAEHAEQWSRRESARHAATSEASRAMLAAGNLKQRRR